METNVSKDSTAKEVAKNLEKTLDRVNDKLIEVVADNVAKSLGGDKPAIMKLPSGKTASMIEFKGKHIREAQRLANGEASSLIFAIIAVTTTIDGEPVLLEDLDEMGGMDVMELMGQFGSNFTLAPSK